MILFKIPIQSVWFWIFFVTLIWRHIPFQCYIVPVWKHHIYPKNLCPCGYVKRGSRTDPVNRRKKKKKINHNFIGKNRSCLWDKNMGCVAYFGYKNHWMSMLKRTNFIWIIESWSFMCRSSNKLFWVNGWQRINITNSIRII